MLTAILGAAAGWPAPVVLTVVCALLIVESGSLLGMVLPGTTLLVALGLWSHAAPDVLVPAVVAAAAATVTGAHVGWWRGRSGAPVGRKGGRIARLAAARAARASSWLADRGPPATAALLAAGHWAAAARPVLPRVAGAAGVPYRTAGPVLLVSGSAWAATLVLLGNRLGPLVLTSATWVPIVLVLLLIGALAVHARRSRAAGVDEGPDAVPSGAPGAAPRTPTAPPRPDRPVLVCAAQPAAGTRCP